MKSKKVLTADLENLIPILIGVWRRFSKQSGPPDVLQTREFRSVVAAVKVLQERFDKGQSLAGEDYFQKPELLGAYILYQWIVHYQQGLSLIGELPTTPRRVLDICSGPAPLAFAALKHGAKEVIALDQNATALQLGAEISGRYGMPLTVRQWNSNKNKTMPVEGKFDLIILGHCLEELFPPVKKGWSDAQEAFIQSLLQRLTPNGHLLIVESSFKEANRRVLQLRENLVKQGVPVQAPCVWRGECPALKTPNSPCYAQREFEKPYLIREIQRAASINLSSLKMSYLILRQPEAGWPALPEYPVHRVISPPVDSFHGKRFYLCGTEGKKSLGSRLTTQPIQSKAFDYLKRGELISIKDALETPLTLDIIEGSTVRIEAACGKPLPDYNEMKPD